MKNLKPWRVNLVIVHKGLSPVCRETIHATLQGLAYLRGIDCARSSDHLMLDAPDCEQHISQTDIPFDIAYFRSTPRTKISAKEFRSVIQVALDIHHLVGLVDMDVFFQMQKILKDYPFPKV